MLNDGKPTTIRFRIHKHRENGKVDIQKIKTILQGGLPARTRPDPENENLCEYEHQGYIERLKITLPFLQIPDYDLFADLICNAVAELSRYPEDYGIYKIRDIELLSIFMRGKNLGDFTRALCDIQMLLDLISWPKTRKLPRVVEDISKSFHTVLRRLRDAIHSQGMVVDGKKMTYHPGMPQTIAWQYFVNFKKTFVRNSLVNALKAVNKDIASTKQNDLTDTESNILEALGDSTLHGPELLKKAGYDNSSHYRAILSGLVKRDILDRNACGYHLKSAPRQ